MIVPLIVPLTYDVSSTVLAAFFKRLRLVNRKFILVFLMALISGFGLRAQVVLQSFVEVGETNVSEGIYLKNGYRSIYQYQRFLLEAGFLAELNESNPVRISGVDLAFSTDVKLKQLPLNFRAFYLLNFISEYMYESNTGFTLEMTKWKYIGLSVGNNLKTFTYTRLAMDEFLLTTNNRRFTEYFNLIYDLTAYLKPIGNEWNLGVSFTNIIIFPIICTAC